MKYEIHVWLFICWKITLKKNSFLKKYLCILQNIHYMQKKCFYMEKESYWKMFLLEKTFLQRKISMKMYDIYISFEKCIFREKIFVLQTKCKSFLNIYSFCKKIFFDHKKYICQNYVANSIIWSLQFGRHLICGIP